MLKISLEIGAFRDNFSWSFRTRGKSSELFCEIGLTVVSIELDIIVSFCRETQLHYLQTNKWNIARLRCTCIESHNCDTPEQLSYWKACLLAWYFLEWVLLARWVWMRWKLRSSKVSSFFHEEAKSLSCLLNCSLQAFS